MIPGLGDRIKKERKNRGISQKELAIALGISQGYVSDIEAGKKTPGGDVLVSLSKYFSMSLVVGDGEYADKRASTPSLCDRTYAGPDRRRSLEIAENQFCFTKGPPRLTHKESRLLLAFRGLTEQQQEDKLFELEALAERNESREKLGGGSA